MKKFIQRYINAIRLLFNLPVITEQEESYPKYTVVDKIELKSLFNKDKDFCNANWGCSPADSVSGESNFKYFNDNLRNSTYKSLEYVYSSEITKTFHFDSNYTLIGGVITFERVSDFYGKTALNDLINIMTEIYEMPPHLEKEWKVSCADHDPNYTKNYIAVLEEIYKNNYEKAIDDKKLNLFYVWTTGNTVIKMAKKTYKNQIIIVFSSREHEWMGW